MHGATLFQKSKQFVISHPYVVLLVAISIVLCMVNYQAGTWLSGWDTLHPEFNLWLYIKRIVFGVWQEHQGLGAVASQSHIAEIPRMLPYAIMVLLLPDSLVRYGYLFGCLVLGPLGIYAFLRRIIFPRTEDELAKPAAFAGALFYLLNLGTLQQFYVPLEMFVTQYAALGWLFLYATIYWQHPTKKHALIFALISLFAAPQAHTATLFYAYVSGLGVYIVGLQLGFHQRLSRTKLIHGIQVLAITLGVNAFWLLPNIYYILNHAHDVEASKISRLFSDEAFLSNQAAGTIVNTFILKNYLFDWGEMKPDFTFGNLMGPWNAHIQNPVVLLIGFCAFGVIICGIWYTFYRKLAIRYAVLAVFLLGMFFLINANPPFSPIFTFLRDHSSLFREAVRFPFTKFSLLLMFSYAVFFAVGWYLAMGLVIKRLVSFERQEHVRPLRKLILARALVGVLCLILGFYMWPAFQGNLINPAMKVKFPKAYFDMFAWFAKQPNDGRVADFPVHSFWGWTYYKWGYQGAGFLWFGIPQPLLNREFDRWDSFNEEYYREMSEAVYGNDLNRMEKLFDKYQIRYLLVDESVIVPGSAANTSQTYVKELEALLATSSRVEGPKTFSPTLKVYQVTQPPIYQSYVYTPKKFVQIEPMFTWGVSDPAYDAFGTYVSDVPGGDSVGYGSFLTKYIYPYRSLLNGTDGINRTAVRLTRDAYELKTPIELPQELVLPDIQRNTIGIPTELALTGGQLQLTYELPGLTTPTGQGVVSQLAMPGGASSVLVVNGDNTFPLSSIGPNGKIGRVSLKSTSANMFRLFAIPAQGQPVQLTGISTLAPERCSEADSNQLFGTSEANRGYGVTVFGQNANACVKIPLTKLVGNQRQSGNAPLLLAVSFAVSSDGKAKPGFCFYDTTDGKCLKAQHEIVNNTTVQEYIELPADQLASVGVEFFVDALSVDKLATVTFGALSVGLSPQSWQTSVTPDQLAAVIDTTVTQGFKGKAVALNSKYVNTDQKNSIFNVSRKPQSCNLFGTGEFSREVKQEDKREFIRYSSKNGSSCDYFSFPDVKQDRAYVLSIVSRNTSGLPLRLCVSNYVTKRCDLYTNLPDRNQFVESLYLLPPHDPTGIGYDVNINNYAIGQTTSQNDIASVRLIEFPYAWLASLHATVSTDPTALLGGGGLKNGHRWNTELYTATVEMKNNKPTLLVLNQAFEPGWVAISGGWFARPHIMVNNWANGWILSPQEKDGTKHIVILFLPQFLEWIGMGVTVWLIIHLWQASRKRVMDHEQEPPTYG